MSSVFFFAFILEIVLIYFLSRQTIKNLFILFRSVFSEKKTVYFFISLIFFPGTLVHEFGHLIAATLLNLNILEVKVFPEFKENQIKLGRVVYGKKDFIRGILVGIAPFFFAIFFFWLLAKWHIFPSKNLVLNLIFGYLIFTVSSTMFSSKQDLVDFALILPLIIFIIGIIYIFNIKIDWFLKNIWFQETVIKFLKEVNFYLVFSLGIHLVINSLFYFSRLFFKK